MIRIAQARMRLKLISGWKPYNKSRAHGVLVTCAYANDKVPGSSLGCYIEKNFLNDIIDRWCVV